MKNSIKLYVLFVLVSLVQSCKEQPQKTTKKEIEKSSIIEKSIEEGTITSPTEFKSKLMAYENLKLNTVYTDTVNYVKFDDNFDYWLFFVKKQKDTIGLIYNKEELPKFVKGEEIEIQWKMDSLRPAGDPEFLDFKEFCLSAKRLKPLLLANKKVKFLWREDKYDEELKTDINSIVLNQEYIATISDSEKAVLAYIATFIGNECEWDGKPNENRSNLKCKIPWALGLNYQCSSEHLDFLKFWFRNNEDILAELEKCPKKPSGATVQNTFDEINLEVANNTIMVFFKASGYNLRENEHWKWTEKHVFKFKENELIHTKKEVSPKTKSIDTVNDYASVTKEHSIKPVSKIEAEKIYGKPYSSVKFILDDAQGEFRNSISNCYTQKQRQSKSITINEITWEKDKSNWITIWYEVQKEKNIPKDILIWNKGTEF